MRGLNEDAAGSGRSPRFQERTDAAPYPRGREYDAGTTNPLDLCAFAAQAGVAGQPVVEGTPTTSTAFPCFV